MKAETKETQMTKSMVVRKKHADKVESLFAKDRDEMKELIKTLEARVARSKEIIATYN